MKCEEVRDELIAYARGELSDARATEIEEHLVRCQECTRELEGARKVMALTQRADTASIHNLAQEILHAALARRASDIHVERGKDAPRLRFRIDGVLQVQPEPVVTLGQYEPLIARIKQMAAQNLSETRVPQDGRFQMAHGGKEYELRVNVFPYFNGESAVLRILDRSSVLIGLNKLGLYPRPLTQIEAILDRRAGLVFAAGPTGAGKTTLLYSILSKLNRPELKIMTIEDPVEYQMEGIQQAGLNQRAGLTFTTGLRGLMRQDPDVIMVGEIRDIDTIGIAMRAAQTGHLVLSVIHSLDTISAVSRLLDVGVEPFNLASSLTGIVAQRLVRRICPACEAPYQPPQSLLEALDLTAYTRPRQLTHGAGCEQCGGTGYQGRLGLFEVLTINEVLARMIAGRAPEADLRARALETDLLWSFVADARAKIADGLTTAEEVDRVLPGLVSPAPAP